MDGEYEVFQDLKAVGKVTLKREGLYYHIRCAYEGTDGMIRLMADTDTGSADLGLCVPMGTMFGLETRIPCRLLQGKGLRFRLQTECKKDIQRFIPVCAGEPFGYLAELACAVFTVREGQAGIVLLSKDSAQDR